MADAEFSLSCRGLSSRQLLDVLLTGTAADAAASGDLSFEVRRAPHDTRSLDPTVLVAITGAVSTAVTCIVTGLFQLAKKTERGSIIVLTSSGARLEAPADSTPEELELFISKARQLDVAHIHVSGQG